jgi:hypothetical protein
LPFRQVNLKVKPPRRRKTEGKLAKPIALGVRYGLLARHQSYLNRFKVSIRIGLVRKLPHQGHADSFGLEFGPQVDEKIDPFENSMFRGSGVNGGTYAGHGPTARPGQDLLCRCPPELSETLRGLKDGLCLGDNGRGRRFRGNEGGCLNALVKRGRFAAGGATRDMIPQLRKFRRLNQPTNEIAQFSVRQVIQWLLRIPGTTTPGPRRGSESSQGAAPALK